MPSGPSARATPIQARFRRILAQNITKFREARELTQKDLAALTGLSPDWISMIEQGRVNPTLDVIVELSMGLKVRPAQLLMPPEHDTK